MIEKKLEIEVIESDESYEASEALLSVRAFAKAAEEEEAAEYHRAKRRGEDV